MNNYFVSFKVTPPQMQYAYVNVFPILETFLKRSFWYRQQLLLRFFFYLLKRSKTLAFHRCLLFWKEDKVSGAKSGEYGD